MEKIKKHSSWVAVFIINVLVMVLGYQFIKDNDKNKLALKAELQTELQPIDQSILDAQNKIMNDRENKLRKLNNAPKAVKQSVVTTNVKTTVPTTKSSTKTKTS